MANTSKPTEFPGLLIAMQPARGRRSAYARFYIRRSKLLNPVTVYIGTEVTYAANYEEKFRQAKAEWDRQGHVLAGIKHV